MKGTIPILRFGHTLIASIQTELRDNVAQGFQEDVLLELEKRGTRGLVVDISGLEMVDTYVARVLTETARMAKLMGAETVLVGMRPEIAATLVRMGYAMDGVRTALNLEEGLALLGGKGEVDVGEDVLEHHDLRIDVEDDIILVRRKVREVATSCRFDVFAASAVTTAASELARNVWTHAGRGIAHIKKVSDDARLGVRVEFEDEGPGIADVERALAGGYSTAKSLGLGLSGSRRLVDEFMLESNPGHGTKVTFVKWAPY